MALTVVMLVGDLARSERFLNVVLRPQGRSWLARGAWFLILYSALAAAYGAAQVWGCPVGARWLLVPTALGGVLAAIYTAFLFGQCEGCDLWQTPLLPLHLLVQGALSSGAVLSFVALGEGGAVLRAVAVPALGAGLVLHALLLLGEIGMRHTTDNARYATRLIVEGPYRAMFWLGALGLGIVFPAVLLVVGAASGPAIAAAGAAVLAGLLAWEWCFVMAGQGVPNS
jgi:formate-dependent nitrite reductase membrane component NrfD